MTDRHIDLQGKVVDLKPISPTERVAAVVDRELQKEVARINSTESPAKVNAANPVWIGSDGAVFEVFEDRIEVANSPLPTNDFILSKDEPVTKYMNTNRTGLAGLMVALKNDIKSAQDESLAAGDDLSNAIANAREAASGVRKLAKEIDQEAAEAMSALGQLTNGAPE